MARTGITYHEVANAIATLQGMQKNPTVDNIRDELGTGSKSTIARLLREWKSKNGMTNTNEEGIPNELQQLIRGLWEKTQSDADEKIKTHQLEADAQISEAKNNVALTQQQNALLHAEIKTLSDKLTEQTNNAEALKNTIHQAENEKSKLLERISMLESQNLNNKNENDRLHQLLKNTQENLTHYQNAIQQQRQEQTLTLEKIRHESEMKIGHLQNQLDKLSQEKIQFETHCAHLENTNEKLTSDNEKLQQQKHDVEMSYQRLTIINTQLEQSNRDMMQKNELCSHELQSHHNQLSEIKISYAADKNKIMMLESQLQKSESHCIDLQNQFKTMLSEKLRLENIVAQHSGVTD